MLDKSIPKIINSTSKQNRCAWALTNRTCLKSQHMEHHVSVRVFVLANIMVSLNQKMFVLITWNNIYLINVSRIVVNSTLTTQSPVSVYSNSHPVWLWWVLGSNMLAACQEWVLRQVDVRHVSHASFKLTSLPVLPFSKLNKIFFGYFDPENIFLDNKNK